MRLRRGPRAGHDPRSTWLGRLVRGWRPDRNPLRRGTDRAEIAIGAALLVAFLVGLPFAAHAAASWTNDISQHEFNAQQATFHQVRATLLEAPVTAQSYGVTLAPQADARWIAPDGQVRTGLLTVPTDAKKGSTVLIWTDQSGALVTPLLPGQIPMRNDLAATAAVTLLAIMLLVIVWMVHRALNRRRMAAWEADWLATGPRWTSRR